MRVYTVERMDKYDYDFSVEIKKYGAFRDRNNALKKAKEVYHSMCGEYEDDIERYSDKDVYIDEDVGGLYVIEDNEFGYYADEIIYYLQDSNFANEYYDMNNTQRLKFLNKILQVLGYYGSYEVLEV